MNVTYICFVITMSAFLSETSEINQDLVFALQELFMSDVILLTRNKESSDKLSRKIYKLHNFKAFIGTINLDDNVFVQNFKREMMLSHQNIMIVSDSATRLEELINYSSLNMASIIWVCYISDDVADNTKDLYIPHNSRFFLIKKIKTNDYEISDVYQISDKSSKINSVFGHFTDGKLKVTHQSFYYRRRDLRGHEFNISLAAHPNYVKKFGYIWELFSEGMNFSVYSNYNKFGTIESNGTLTGLFKLLDEHQIDGTPSIFIVTKQRLDYFDCIFPTAISETHMYIHVQTDLNWVSYLAPFSSNVWISIVAWVALYAIILQVITYTKIMKKYFLESLFDIMGALCYQAGNFNISSPALHILHLMPYLLAIILVQYYSGQLLSNLTVKNVIVPFQNLKEATKDGRYKIIALKDTFAELYFRTNEGYEATAVRKKGLLESPDKMPMTMPDAYHKLCKGRYIFIPVSAFDFTVRESCYITELKTVIFYDSFGILVWKGFPFKNDLTKLMRQIQFSGLVKLKQNSIVVPKDEGRDLQPLSIELIFPVFLLLLAIMVISGFILLCEFFVKIAFAKENLRKSIISK